MRPRPVIAIRTAVLATLVCALAVGAAVLFVPTRAGAAGGMHGHVRSGLTPLGAFHVTLFVAGDATGPATALADATTAPDGAFDLAYSAPTTPDAVLYLVASGPEAATLVDVLGAGTPPTDVVVNDRTTVASAYAMTQFADGDALGGPTPGLQNAAAMVRDLVDVETGEVGSVLATSPNGPDTSTLNTFNSLANMVASCVGTPANCAQLLSLITPPGGPTPTDTFQAMVSLNRFPSTHAAGLFAFAPLLPYTPPRATAPDAWTVALRFVGDGVSMDGPGNMVVDAQGNVWSTNNYEYSPNAVTPVCGGESVLAFSPTGQYLDGSPFSGGGVDGAGWGIDIDPFGDLWVSNFGFGAPVPGCPAERQPLHNSVSLFHLDGTAVSPALGYTQGGIAWPQGAKSDAQGNIWMANCQSNSVTVYPQGDPNRAREYGGVGLDKPFAIAHDRDGNAYVTSVANDSVVMLRPDGTPALAAPISGGGLNRPLGIVADSLGNQWVANSGLIDLPCPLFDTGSVGGSVTMIDAGGHLASPTPFTGGGLTIPWGIAVDGADHVWVANFAGKRLSVFCGARPEACPAGLTTGDPISPDTGYGFDGLVRNTGVVIDPSGNVWVANNWKEVPIQANPGGYEMVVFVGSAAPVQRASPIARPARAVSLLPRFTG